MKRHVLFGNYPDLDDCAHVCYGSKEGQAYNPDHWDPIRAERIGWIYHALTKPNAICPDSKVGRHEKYLLFVPKDDVITFDQHYVVITRLMEKRKVAFITAYHITSTQYDTAKNVRPHIYPVEPPRRKRGK